MGQIRHYNNGKWTIFTTGEELSTKSGVTNTYYIGPNLSDGIYTKVDPDGTKIDLESSSGGGGIDYWTSGSTGVFSIKANNDSNLDATAAYAVAEGNGTLASGLDSHAEGYITIASGSSAHSEGNQTIAGGDSSHAEGQNTKAYGSYSHAEGLSTIANGFTSHAEGINNTVLGVASHVEGSGNTVNTDYSHVGGTNNTAASGSTILITSSHSFIGGGNNNFTRERHSTILNGVNNKADARYSTVINGYANLNYGNYSIIGGGIGNYVNTGYGFIGTGGYNNVLGGGGVIGSGSYNTAGGSYTSGTFIGSGSNNLAKAHMGAILVGKNNTITYNGSPNASKYSTIINGYGNNILGSYSTILGGRNNFVISGLSHTHIIGNAITASTSNTTYVNKLNIKNITTGTGTTITNLGIDGGGNLVKGPKVYKALLTQSGTNAPVSTVLVNTLSGTPVWSRVSIGYYKLTLSSEFTNNKTYYPPFGEMGNILSDGSSGITLYDDTGGILGFYHFYKLSSSEFVLKSYDGSFNAVDISSIIGTGYICLPPIEVYP